MPRLAAENRQDTFSPYATVSGRRFVRVAESVGRLPGAGVVGGEHAADDRGGVAEVGPDGAAQMGLVSVSCGKGHLRQAIGSGVPGDCLEPLEAQDAFKGLGPVSEQMMAFASQRSLAEPEAVDEAGYELVA